MLVQFGYGALHAAQCASGVVGRRIAIESGLVGGDVPERSASVPQHNGGCTSLGVVAGKLFGQALKHVGADREASGFVGDEATAPLYKGDWAHGAWRVETGRWSRGQPLPSETRWRGGRSRGTASKFGGGRACRFPLKNSTKTDLRPRWWVRARCRRE